MKTTSRSICRNIIKTSVPAETWQDNEKFVNELKGIIAGHRLLHHPALTAMTGGQLSKEAMVGLHLEFRYAFSEIFTDALLQAQVAASELEPRFGPVAKTAARFLLQFNVMDELGFVPAGDQYGGTPLDAHYVKLWGTMKELGLTEAEIKQYVPSSAARRCRQMIESGYGKYLDVLAFLAVSETVFDSYAGPWAKNVGSKTEVDTRAGYHAIHVATEGPSLDVEHSGDLWYAIMQAVEREQYGRVRENTIQFLDVLVGFIDNLAKG